MLKMRLKILSLNVRGLRSPTKVISLCNELETLNFDTSPALNKQKFLNDLGGANVTGPSGPVNRLAWPFCSRLTSPALCNVFFLTLTVAS